MPAVEVVAPAQSPAVDLGVHDGHVVASTQLESRETDSGEGSVDPDGL